MTWETLSTTEGGKADCLCPDLMYKASNSKGLAGQRLPMGEYAGDPEGDAGSTKVGTRLFTEHSMQFATLTFLVEFAPGAEWPRYGPTVER